MSSPFAYIAILPVRFYQRFISPMFAPRCRYYPPAQAMLWAPCTPTASSKGQFWPCGASFVVIRGASAGSMKFPLAASGLARPGSLRQIGPDTTTLGHGPSWA